MYNLLFTSRKVNLNYYIVLTKIHTQRIKEECSPQSTLPKSDLVLLAENLGASFIEQDDYPVKPIDRIRAQLSSTPENWAFARAIASQLKPDDVVFCPGEEIGIPLVSVCGAKQERPKIVVWFHRITGLRSRIALKLFRIGQLVDLAVVSNRPNQIFLQNYLNLTEEQILFWWHTINVDYFASKMLSTSSSKNPRPLVVSCGLERRDYKLLAAATSNLDLDVKVAGFSQFQSRAAKHFPKILPENMSNKRYSFPELMKLYYDADVVAVCLKQNNGLAGVTVLLEAIACRKPIVCTRTKGLNEYLNDEQAIMTIEPGDVIGLQKSILYLLEHPEEAKQRAERAYQLVCQRHNLEQPVDVLAQFIRTLE